MDKQLHKTHRESGVVQETKKCAVKLPSKIRDGPWRYSLKDKQNSFNQLDDDTWTIIKEAS